MMTFATTTVTLRFYTRRFILRILGVEDWLVLVAMVLAIGACIGFIRQTFYGLGHHVWTLSQENIQQWNMEQWYSFLFYTMSLSFTKMSILFLYLRVMVHGPMRIINLVVLGIVVVCNIWSFISNFVSCIPLEAGWDSSIQGTCLGVAVSLANSVIHVITDFIIFLLPLPVILKLKINKKQKIGLVAVFSLGFLVCVISLVRIISITKLDFSDPPYQVSLVAYWGAVEVNLAIICACLTTLKPLLARFFPKLLGSTYHTSTYNPGSAVLRTGATAPGAQRTRVTVKDEERGFTRLDDDSDKLAETPNTPEPMYEMDYRVRRGSYAVSPPSKAHVRLGLT